ncbi:MULTISPECIES: hypothetical protein [unclassified Modestobacter]
MRIRPETHPADGTLRRLLDEPAGVPDADRAHVAGCPACLQRLTAVEADATAAASAMATAGTAPDVDHAWLRLQAATRPAPDPATTARGAAPARSWRNRLRSPVVAAFGVVLVVGGAGAAAAGDWVQVFRTEEIAPVAVTEADLVALPDLSAYGTLQAVAEPGMHEVADAAAAEEATGLTVPRVDELPRGVVGEPTYTVGDQLVAEFTFSTDQAAQAAAAAGEELPPVPAGLDGSTFRLTAGPGIAAVWSEARGLPALAVGRVTAPTAESSGVPFDVARDYLLSLPGLPDSLSDQLRTFTGDGTTLPLPVPAELATTSTTEVDGERATLLASRDGLLHGVVWVADGVVTGVAGTISEDEVLDVARGLR